MSRAACSARGIVGDSRLRAMRGQSEQSHEEVQEGYECLVVEYERVSVGCDVGQIARVQSHV